MYGGNPIQAIAIRAAVPPSTQVRMVGGTSRTCGSALGAVAELRFVAAREGCERSASADCQSSELDGRHGRSFVHELSRLVRGIEDVHEDVLPEAGQDGFDQLHEDEVVDLAGRRDLDARVGLGAFAVDGRVAAVVVAGHDLAVEHLVALAGGGLGGLDDVLNFSDEEGAELLHVGRELLRELGRSFVSLRAREDALEIDGDTDRDVLARGLDLAAVCQPCHSKGLPFGFCLDRDVPFRLLAEEQPYYITLKLPFCQ